jgi:hypothetical protein
VTATSAKYWKVAYLRIEILGEIVFAALGADAIDLDVYPVVGKTEGPGFHAYVERSDTWQIPQLSDGRAVQLEVELTSLQTDNESAGIVRGLEQNVISVHVPMWCRGREPLGGSLGAHRINDKSLLALRRFDNGRLQPRCVDHAGTSSLSLQCASSQLGVPFFPLTKP